MYISGNAPPPWLSSYRKRQILQEVTAEPTVVGVTTGVCGGVHVVSTYQKNAPKEYDMEMMTGAT